MPSGPTRVTALFVRDERPIVLVLPRFSPWMKRLSIAVVAIWLLEILLGYTAPGAAQWLLNHLMLVGSRIVPRLELWRVASYPWLEDPGSFGAFWTVLSLWLLGSPVERLQGTRRVAELFAVGTIGGAIAAVAAGRLSIELYNEPVVGMAGFTSALLSALGFLYANEMVSFFGLGPMRGKHLILGLAAIDVLLALSSRSATGAASIGGLLFGAAWMWWNLRRDASGGRGVGSGRSRSSSGARFRVVQGGKNESGSKKLWN